MCTCCIFLGGGRDYQNVSLTPAINIFRTRIENQINDIQEQSEKKKIEVCLAIDQHVTLRQPV